MGSGSQRSQPLAASARRRSECPRLAISEIASQGAGAFRTESAKSRVVRQSLDELFGKAITREGPDGMDLVVEQARPNPTSAARAARARRRGRGVARLAVTHVDDATVGFDVALEQRQALARRST